MLRRLEPGDLDAVAALEVELFDAQAWSRGAYVEELANPSRRYLAADDDSELIGYAGILLASDAQVMTIGVHPAHRRRGVATALLDGLLAAARAHGSREVLLEVRAEDPGAQALYAAAGFGVLGRRPDYYGTGVDALVMRLVLRRGQGFLG